MIENLHIIEPCLIDHLLFIFLAIVLPILGIISSKGLEDFKFDKETKLSIYYSNGFFLWILALIVLTVWNYTDRSFENLGFESPEWSYIVVILTIAFILLYVIELFSKRIFLKMEKKMDWAKNLQFLPENFDEFKHYIFLVLAAGICEEILFRGFLIHYIYSFFSGSIMGLWISICLPAVVFAIGHSYQGNWAIIKILLGAMILSTIYLFSGSLYIVILIHISVDIISALFAKSLLKDATSKEEDSEIKIDL